jgi:SAM-dependent methyltransferase
VDWGVGHYETTAQQLLPAAHVVVDAVDPQPGELVVDVGCGTGNASILTAERGAGVVGVDPAERLLEVAADLAVAADVDASFLRGEAADLPVGDAEADAVLSAFGVIFASDPAAAAAEIARVTKPDGRVVISAWIPNAGAVSRAVRVAREAIERATAHSSAEGHQGEPFAWHERDSLAGLFDPHGFEVAASEHEVTFSADSPRAFVEAEYENHPMWIAGRAVLEPRGEADAVRDRVIEIFGEENETPGAFSVTSRYIVAKMRRSGGAAS